MRKPPIPYSLKAARRYCALIAQGYSGPTLRNRPDLPTRETIWQWRQKHPEFRRLLEAARARRAINAARAGRRDPGRGGRPSLKTPQMLERVCELVAAGLSLGEIAELPGMPSASSLHNWKDEDPDFERAYFAAWEAHAQAVADETVRIADRALGEDWTDRSISAREALAAARLKIETRIKRVLQLGPKRMARAQKDGEKELTYAERIALLK